MPKELGNSKGITENPILKIELTKTNAFRVTTFGSIWMLKGRVGLQLQLSLKRKFQRNREQRQ
jgi:hypothetical protein